MEMMTVKEVAAALKLSARSVYRQSDSGRLPRPLKIGSAVRWRAEEIRQWVDAGAPSVREATRE